EAIDREGITLGMDGREVLLAFPNQDRLPPAFAAGSPATLKVVDALGVHRARTRITRTLKFVESGLSVLMPDSFETTQQRRFFRVMAELPFTYTVRIAAEAR